MFIRLSSRCLNFRGARWNCFTIFPYPQEAKEKGVQGRVFIGFVIEKDGSISNVRNLRGVDSELDAEAMRIVESMPKWKPGMHNGEFVRVSYQIPIHFKLEDKQD